MSNPVISQLHVKATPFMADDQRSVLITLSARALSSVGLGLSILAIWLGWILPANHVPGYRRETPVDLSRRRSALSAPPIPRLSPPVRRLPTPVLSSNDATRSEDPGGNRTRRVYFLDSPVRNQSPKRKRRSPLAGRSFQRSLSPSPRPNLENSCRSSLSPSPALVDGSAQSPDSCDISIAESESSNHSSRASLSLATHLPRVKSVFSTKGRRSSEISETIANAVEPMLLDEFFKPTRRLSNGFTTHWSISRSRTTVDTTSDIVSTKSDSSSHRLSFTRCISGSKHTSRPSTTSLGSVPAPSTSYFSKKAQRRASTPVPARRTLPYEAPYFAAPPISTSPDSSHQRGLFQPVDGSRLDDQPDTSDRPRGRERRQMDDQIQVALGHERRSVPKRRSASESWTKGPVSQL